MADTFTVPDPEVFPVQFKFKRRVFRPFDNTNVSAIFAVNPSPVSADIAAAVYRYDSQYGLDIDPFGDDVPSAPIGSRVLFEATTDSSSLSASSLIVKTWSSSSAFTISQQGKIKNIRQGSSDSSLISSFYVGSSLSRFDAETVSGVDYYPTVTPYVEVFTFYDTDEANQSFSVVSGSSVDKTMASADNAGIAWVWFAMTAKWYLDKERTIQAVSVPSSIDLDPVDIVVRLVITKDGRFGKTGEISSDGSAFFTQIIRDADSEGKAQMSYVALDSSYDLFISTQDNVRIDGNGLPIQVDNDSSIYLLNNNFPDPSSSSSSNSESSSSSSSESLFFGAAMFEGDGIQIYNDSSSSRSSSSSISSSSSSSSSYSSSSSSKSSSFSSSNGAELLGYEVSDGTGDIDANGTYCLAGIHDGKNYYTYSGNSTWYLFWNNDMYGNYWWVADGLGSDFTGPSCTYYVDSEVDDPPLEGWISNVGGIAPTLSNTPC